MATYLEYISFRNALPWYRKLFFPKLLNKAQRLRYLALVAGGKTDLDVARDNFLFAWCSYKDNPNLQNKQAMEFYKTIVEYRIKKNDQ